MQTIEVLKKMSDRVELVKQRVDFADRWFHYSTTPFRRGRGGRVVYCGGLENRFGFTADGGSNPSLSARIAGVDGEFGGGGKMPHKNRMRICE